MSDTSFDKIQRVRAFDKAVQQLRTAILEGEFLTGEKLPTEQELCDVMDVGRSTIREALRVLEAEGLIEVRRGSGAYVTDKLNSIATRGEILRWLSQREESVMQILHVREAIEGLTARLAAQNSSPELIAKLNHFVEEQKDVAESDRQANKMAKLAELDVKFHTSISSASQNDLAHEIVSQIVPAFAEANRAILWVGDGITDSIEEHEKVVRAIERQEPAVAERCIREHIQRVQDEICKYLEEACEE